MITLAQRERIQARLNHYLLRSRNHLDITQKEMAYKLGYSVSSYRGFERETELDNKVINALETLKHFAEIQSMDVGSFASYLEKGSKVGRSENTLRKWEFELLESLKKLEDRPRRILSEYIIKCSKNEIGPLVELIQLVKGIGSDHIEGLKKFCEGLLKRS